VTDIIELSTEENDTWSWVDTAELKIQNCNPHFETWTWPRSKNPNPALPQQLFLKPDLHALKAKFKEW